MYNDLAREFAFGAWKSEHSSAGNFGSYTLVIFAVILLATHFASSQMTDAPAFPSVSSTTSGVADDALAKGVIATPKQTPRSHPAESEISVMGMLPDGDYRMFSATVRCKAWTVGVEYDHPFPRTFLKARADYATEILPFVLLSQPAVSDFWGNGLSPNQRLMPGLAILPIGFRFLWRGSRAVKPYVVGKFGGIIFTRKALSPDASNANFNVQAAFGLQIRLTKRLDLRVEPFEFFHVSNGYLTASNPGMDELATRFGVTYHLRKKAQ
ncbi:MAG TPA: acyloxyacyl hydrolase [Edaphobacter sp.]